MRAMATPSADDGPRFHSNMPVSELTKRDTRAIEATVVSSAPLVAETEDGVTYEIWPTPTKPHEARGLKPPNPKSGVQLIGVQRPACEGPEAARRTEPREKMKMSPSGLCLTRLKADRVISTISFDPNLEPSPHNLH